MQDGNDRHLLMQKHEARRELRYVNIRRSVGESLLLTGGLCVEFADGHAQYRTDGFTV